MVFIDNVSEIPAGNDKDETTARYLHKLAMNAKQKNLPSSVIAHYEIQSWKALNSEEKFRSCKKCCMPPTPPFESSTKAKSSKICIACGFENKHNIEVISASSKPESSTFLVQKKVETLKRANCEATKPIVAKSGKPQAQSRTPQNYYFAKKSKISADLLKTPSTSKEPATPPLLLQSANNKKRGKKTKVTMVEEPDFLQKLFGIGATPK